MPLVRIDIMEGRPPERIRELHERVAALVAEVLETPVDRVRTYITQFPPEAWGIGGVPADVARADDVAAREAAAQARAAAATAPADGAASTDATGTVAAVGSAGGPDAASTVADGGGAP